MHPIFFIHSPDDGYSGCFHVLAAVNTAAVNIRVHVPLELWFSPGICSGVGLLGQKGVKSEREKYYITLLIWGI